ncbi:protein-glutamate O-methyltransferase-like isoform X2 [Cimex lectularius]|nr:protein-glutamate O-methyltransferase-like isoform X2 [Cimex lectularius]XP_014251734.1 protein-glutamate O-methyltransferase-like isoform X2 [Cimex lectularius]
MKLLIDSETPLNTRLSAKYKRSFAYLSMKDRAPLALTKVIDYLVRDKRGIEKTYGPGAIEEVKCAIGELSQLKNHLQTSKPFENFISKDPDTTTWNQHLEARELHNEVNNYYESDWLFAECYLYRRIRESFATKKLICSIDPFSVQKTQVLDSALDIMEPMFCYLYQSKLMDKQTVLPKDDLVNECVRLLKWCLWANKIDLSFKPDLQEGGNIADAFLKIDQWDNKIVIDNSEKVGLCCIEPGYKKVVDIVMDNAGLEMLCDMTLADFLISKCGVDLVNFHVKPIPWFVSDVIIRDFMQGVESIAKSERKHFKNIGLRWQHYLDKGVWKLHADTYWCLGLPYQLMEETDPSLYKKLSRSSLIIFKGDLNYRKLVRDINWEPSTPFEKVLDCFRPAPLVTLRTLKAATVCGMNEQKAEELDENDPNWWTSGNYALIQYCPDV